MPARTKVTVYEGMREQKSLRLITRFEPLHVTLAPASRTMRVLRSVIEIAALAMLNVRENPSSRHAVAPEFIRHNHARNCQRERRPLREWSTNWNAVRSSRMLAVVTVGRPCSWRRLFRSRNSLATTFTGIVTFTGSLRCVGGASGPRSVDEN
jgi:hypothetical protein